MVEVKTYRAVVNHGERYWLVYIPEIDRYTQARTLAEVEPIARDLIALWFEVPESSFDIDIQVQLPDGVGHHLQLAAKYTEDAAHAQAAAAAERRAAARAPKAEGLTVRDIGAALGVSHQRAQQLVSG
jgi:predicted RNase H-like HicB family nuclease